MRTSTLKLIASPLFAAIGLLATPQLHAGEITSFDGASGPGLAAMSFNNFTLTTLNNNDVVGLSPNTIAIRGR